MVLKICSLLALALAKRVGKFYGFSVSSHDKGLLLLSCFPGPCQTLTQADMILLRTPIRQLGIGLLLPPVAQIGMSGFVGTLI